MRPSFALRQVQFLDPVGKLGDSESIYSLMCRNVIRFPGWRASLPKALPGSIFSAHSRIERDILARQLGVPVGWLEKAYGRDLYWHGQFSSCSSRTQLRYCPACMSHSYHSALFQHIALARCPGHNLLLQSRCPACNATIVPTVSVVESAPFECPECNVDLRRSQSADRRSCSIKDVDSLLEKIRADLARPQYPADVIFPISDRNSVLEPASAVTSRHWQRASSFGRGPAACLPRFKQIQISLSAEQLGQVDPLAPGCEMAQWLRANCGCAEQVDYLLSKSGATRGGLIAPAGASLLGMIIFRFVCSYRLEREFTIGHSWSWKYSGPVRYGGQPTDFPEVDARGAQLEMLGWLALNLATHMRTRLMTLEAWSKGLDPMAYAPTVLVNPKVGIAQIRYRADERSVQRLIRRFGDRPFLLA